MEYKLNMGLDYVDKILTFEELKKIQNILK